jgi:glucan phosphorylase
MSSKVKPYLSKRLQDKIPYPLHPLADLASNFWWSWSSEQLSIFRSVDPQLWEQYHHNPVKLLESLPEERLAQLATDPHYIKRVEVLSSQFKQYLEATDTWASREASQFNAQQPVAYFSIEYGFGLCLPTYSGGLGILAADHLKSASDLGLPLVGVGLLYRQGYFHQRLSIDGWVIREGIQGDDKDLQNQVDAESLYRLLEEEIIPCYYDRNDQGLPDRWIGMMKASMKTIPPYFNTHRMVEEYIKQVYLEPVNTPEPVAV